MSEDIMDKIIISTGRAIQFVEPKDDRDAQLISCAYIGYMTKDGFDHEQIVNIAAGIQFGYKELAKAVSPEDDVA